MMPYLCHMKLAASNRWMKLCSFKLPNMEPAQLCMFPSISPVSLPHSRGIGFLLCMGAGVIKRNKT